MIHSSLFRCFTEHSIKESVSKLGPSRDPCQSLCGSELERDWPDQRLSRRPGVADSEQTRAKRAQATPSLCKTDTETLVCLRRRHESRRANEMGSEALNGCHAEAERHRGELLPSQVSLVHASWLAAARFCKGHKGGGGRTGPVRVSRPSRLCRNTRSRPRLSPDAWQLHAPATNR